MKKVLGAIMAAAVLASAVPAFAQETPRLFRTSLETNQSKPKNYSVAPKNGDKSAWICQAGFYHCYQPFSWGIGTSCICNGWAGFIIG